MIPRTWLVVAGVALLIGAASWLLTPVGGPLPRAMPVAPDVETPASSAPEEDAPAEQIAPTPIPSPTASPVPSPAQLAGDSPLASPGDALVSPLATATAAPLPVYTYEIVAAHPHDPEAFTQGLIYVDGVLYEGTGLYGRSSLRRVDLESGETLQQVDLPAQYFGEGITLFDGKIYQLTWQSRTGFIYDAESFERLGSFQYPTQGWGLTHDGQELIMSDGSPTLYWRDAETLAEARRVEVRDARGPVAALNELEYVDGEVWANVWHTDRIARIDAETGAVTGWIDLTGLIAREERSGPDSVLNGIAYDAESDRLFVTGKLWPKLFEIRLKLKE